MRSRLQRPVVPAVAIALVLVTMTCLLAACGGGATTASSSAGTYTDKTYGYSFQYPADWELKAGDTASVTAGATAKSNVGVYDPNGASSGGSYFDLAEVSVYQLQVTVDDSMMADIKTQVQGIFDNLVAQGGDWKALDELTQVTVGGLPGWTISFSFTSAVGASYCRFYVVFGGDREYQLLVQAGAKDWDADQPVFKAFVASFKPGATTGSTTQ